MEDAGVPSARRGPVQRRKVPCSVPFASTAKVRENEGQRDPVLRDGFERFGPRSSNIGRMKTDERPKHCFITRTEASQAHCPLSHLPPPPLEKSPRPQGNIPKMMGSSPPGGGGGHKGRTTRNKTCKLRGVHSPKQPPNRLLGRVFRSTERQAHVPLCLPRILDWEELHMLNRATGMGSPATGLAAGLAATFAAGLAALLPEALAPGLAAWGAQQCTNNTTLSNQ